MSDENPTPTPADIAPKPQEPVATAPEKKPEDAPPWGEDFDAEKAWKLVQNLRADKEKLSSRPTLSDEQKQRLEEYDRLVAASKSELEKAQEAAQTNEQRAQALLTRAVKAEVRALASQGFTDPEDAAAFLDLSSYANDSGEVNTEQIRADLADLLERKPHLGKQPETRKPQPNPAQGASASGSSGPAQLSEKEVKDMYAARDYEGIEKARQEGRLQNILG